MSDSEATLATQVYRQLRNDLLQGRLAPGAKLIALRGPEGSSKEMVSVLRDVGTWFAPLGWKPVELVLSARYAWTVRFAGGTRVELGRDLGEQDRATIAARAARFVRSWPLVSVMFVPHVTLQAAGLTGVTTGVSHVTPPLKPGVVTVNAVTLTLTLVSYTLMASSPPGHDVPKSTAGSSTPAVHCRPARHAAWPTRLASPAVSGVL